MAHIEPSPSRPEPRVLLVEGQNDKHVVLQLCNRHPAIPDFYIQDAGAGDVGDQDSGGIEKLLASIGPQALAPGRETLGILADTDDSLQSRWDELAHQLGGVGIPLPPSPEPGGTIIPASRLRVGVWLMPNNQNTGELEDFVAQMIPQADPVWPLARQYIANIPMPDRKFAAGKTRRAEIHAWLAARAEPRLMGSAIHTLDLSTNAPLCQTFLTWLNHLFA